MRGEREVAQLLLGRGARINGRDPAGQTPLMYAVQSHRDSMVDLPLEAGADVACADEDRLTAMHWAARWDNAYAVDRLLTHHADTKAADVSGQTPLDIAIQFANLLVAERLRPRVGKTSCEGVRDSSGGWFLPLRPRMVRKGGTRTSWAVQC